VDRLDGAGVALSAAVSWSTLGPLTGSLLISNPSVHGQEDLRWRKVGQALGLSTGFQALVSAIFLASQRTEGSRRLTKIAEGSIYIALACAYLGHVYQVMQWGEVSLLGKENLRCRDPRALLTPFMVAMLRMSVIIATGILAGYLPSFSTLFALTGGTLGAFALVLCPVFIHARAVQKTGLVKPPGPTYGALGVGCLLVSSVTVTMICRMLSTDKGWGYQQLKQGGSIIHPRW